jgi:hypothetical protein
MNKQFKYVVSNIEWDTDGDDETAASLPNEMVIASNEEKDADEVIDAASDSTGFCILSADVSAMKDGVLCR